MKTLHTVNAVIELGAGLALLSFPSPVVALLLGSPFGIPTGFSVARVGGSGLLSLGSHAGSLEMTLREGQAQQDEKFPTLMSNQNRRKPKVTNFANDLKTHGPGGKVSNFNVQPHLMMMRYLRSGET
jgi:hypothetical protein